MKKKVAVDPFPRKGKKPIGKYYAGKAPGKVKGRDIWK